ncbi:MAG: pantoate--beta-alanine ligase [Myxococcales bacterium]|nr:MAG: pantoate--beta-alanine ligase [Myxococcales bacterium]
MSDHPVQVLRSVPEFRAACDAVRGRGERLGFVPTMGALHAGHLRLVEVARRYAERVAVSIFVNPTQFGPNEDFSKYPRTLERDVALLGSVGADLVLSPSAEEMYPKGETTRVHVGELSEHFCGPFRPGHFDGVATVVTKLLAMAGPCTAVFGRKDFQQLKIIERLARDLMLPVVVVGEPTVRDADGLALSSRNAYLSADERRRALAIPRALAGAAARFAGGERRAGTLIEPVRADLAGAGLRADYADIADPERLFPFALDAHVGERAVIAVAAFCGTTRLIDNLVLGEDPAPAVSA